MQDGTWRSCFGKRRLDAMSLEDRDWYRAAAHARRKAAEAAAEPGWRRTEGRNKPYKTSDTTRRLIYAGIVLAAGVLVVLHCGNGSGIPGRVAALGQWIQSMERSWSRVMPFPANGTVAAVPEASDDTAPFMVQTPYQPDRRYVVALKEWQSGALVARIYLDGSISRRDCKRSAVGG